LAVERELYASTHRQAMSALLFLYSKVLGLQLPWMTEIGRPRVHRRLPVVLSQDEIAAVFRGMQGEHRCSRSCCVEPACGRPRAGDFV
jgi:hypothetical protein